MNVERVREIRLASPYDTSSRDVVLGGYTAYAHPEEGPGLERLPRPGGLCGRGDTREGAIERAWEKAAVWLAELGAPVETKEHEGIVRPWRARLVYEIPPENLAYHCPSCSVFLAPDDVKEGRCPLCEQPAAMIDGTRWLRVHVIGDAPTVQPTDTFAALGLAAQALAAGACFVELFDEDPRLVAGRPYRTVRLTVEQNHHPAPRPIRGATS